MGAKTAIATVSKATYGAAKNEIEKLGARLKSANIALRAERGVPGALASAGVTLAGAAAGGALAAVIGDDAGMIADLPVSVVGGLVAVGVGVGMGSPTLIEAGAGSIAGYAQAQTFHTVRGFMGDKSAA